MGRAQVEHGLVHERHYGENRELDVLGIVPLAAGLLFRSPDGFDNLPAERRRVRNGLAARAQPLADRKDLLKGKGKVLVPPEQRGRPGIGCHRRIS